MYIFRDHASADVNVSVHSLRMYIQVIIFAGTKFGDFFTIAKLH